MAEQVTYNYTGTCLNWAVSSVDSLGKFTAPAPEWLRLGVILPFVLIVAIPVVLFWKILNTMLFLEAAPGTLSWNPKMNYEAKRVVKYKNHALTHTCCEEADFVEPIIRTRIFRTMRCKCCRLKVTETHMFYMQLQK